MTRGRDRILLATRQRACSRHPDPTGLDDRSGSAIFWAVLRDQYPLVEVHPASDWLSSASYMAETEPPARFRQAEHTSSLVLGQDRESGRPGVQQAADPQIGGASRMTTHIPGTRAGQGHFEREYQRLPLHRPRAIGWLPGSMWRSRTSIISRPASTVCSRRGRCRPGVLGLQSRGRSLSRIRFQAQHEASSVASRRAHPGVSAGYDAPLFV